MKGLYIPGIGDVLTLAKEWQFRLYNEDRNSTLMELLGDTRKIEYGRDITPLDVSLKEGSTLKVDRIYIRKGLDDFSSITFLLVGASIPGKTIEKTATAFGPGGASPFSYTKKIPKKPVRFWVKLDDANKIFFE